MRIKHQTAKQERKALAAWGAHRKGEKRKARRVAKAYARWLSGRA